MANKSINMQKLRQVLRLHNQGKGTKAISSMLDMSRTTVKKYLLRLKESGKDVESLLKLNDFELSTLLQEPVEEVVNERLDAINQLLPLYCKRLKRKGVTREMLHREYKTLHPDGYSRSSFCHMSPPTISSCILNTRQETNYLSTLQVRSYLL